MRNEATNLALIGEYRYFLEKYIYPQYMDELVNQINLEAGGYYIAVLENCTIIMEGQEKGIPSSVYNGIVKNAISTFLSRNMATIKSILYLHSEDFKNINGFNILSRKLEYLLFDIIDINNGKLEIIL